MAGERQNSLDTETLLPWLQLKQVPGIGNLLFKRLLDTFGSPDKVLSAPRRGLIRVKGISPRLADLIRSPGKMAAAQREIKQAKSMGIAILPLNHPDYPALLLEIPDPPPFIYVFGNLKNFQWPLAVVGARNASRYGLDITAQLAGDLSSCGAWIVSGMARGIDTAAHQAALDAGGRTVAVLGSGLNRIYPPENGRLYHRIARQGAVISEFSLDTRPEARNFPIRNRIISGMSLGTVVVEAAQRSGSLITARLAAEQNREVFAVPGSLRSGLSQGSHGLIQQGAKLVTSSADIWEEFDHLIPPEQQHAHSKSGPKAQRDGDGVTHSEDSGNLNEGQLLVLRALGPYPIHLDQLAQKIDPAPGRLAEALLQLELKGLIIQGAGKMYFKGDSN